MNQRTEILGASFKPSLSIVVYRSKIAGDNDHYYLESHDINEAGQVMEGKPLLQETIADIAELFYEDKKERSQVSGFVSENVLSYSPVPGGHFKLVWYRPAEIRYIHFSRELKIPSGRAWVPPVVYEVLGDSLKVYALKGEKRPSENTRLYRGPFHNVSDEGEVCLGNAKVKKPTEKSFANIMKYWEDLFWLSEFSHVNGDDKPVKSDVSKLWARLVKSKSRLKWDKLDELKPTKKQLKDII